jgi:glycosyltransferase involved in cell wall biosynthesis
MRVIIIGALPASLINFRGELIKSLVAEGHEVLVMASGATKVEIVDIECLGVKYIDYSVQRNSLNPLSDIKTMLNFVTVFKKEKPDIVLCYTIKPVIWGGVAARCCKGIKFFALVTGLGYAFQKVGFKGKVLNSIVTILYRLGLSKAKKVIFQNPDNLQVFVDERIIENKQATIVNGSGVNLEHFYRCNLPDSPPVFLTIARLLGDKGLREFAEASRIVKQKYPEVTFQILGPEDPSKDGIPIAEVNSWSNSGAIEYLGASNDVRPFLCLCSIFVLASYHEGMPRTVLEAMAVGRPILTTNVPGCKETVINGENGYLIEKGNVTELVNAILWFIENKSEWQRMADCSFRLAKEHYDVHKVNHDLLSIMELR